MENRSALPDAGEEEERDGGRWLEGVSRGEEGYT